MQFRTNISLKNYTTMQLGGDTRFMALATSVDDIKTVYDNAKSRNLPVFVLGGGSNVIVHDETFEGIVLLNRIQGFEVISDDGNKAVLKIGAGEIWDAVVEKTVQMGLHGIEAMSGIPGTVGAAPVQNIGAYGQELADTFLSLEAYDSASGEVVTLSSEQCEFSYRDSIFRGAQKHRYCILNVTLELYYENPQPPFYAALQRYFDENNVQVFDLAIIRDAVLKIRADKLPDPAKMPNSGSFFKNPIIEKWQLDDLLKIYPSMPNYVMPNGKYKIPSGWLIEQSGLKGQTFRGIRVYEKNALVLVNEGAAGYADLAFAREEIIQTVYEKFNIQLEQEPLEI